MQHSLLPLKSQTGFPSLKKQYIARILDSGLNRSQKNRMISEIIISDLWRTGRFLNAAPYRYYFLWEIRKLFDLDSFEFRVFVREEYGVNYSQAEWRYLIAELYAETHSRGLECDIHNFAFFDPVSSRLYICNGRQVYRLDGQNIESVDNGTDGVLFLTKAGSKHSFEYLNRDHKHDWLSSLILERVNFSAESSQQGLTVEEQREVLRIWLLSLFFESLLPTKPILVLVGEKGSGKTTILRMIGRLLFGLDFDVAAIRRDKEDAFDTAVTHSYLVAWDNVDGKIGWLNDKLAICATGHKLRLRRLYTTNELFEVQTRCFLALTSREPEFKRDDVADRLLILRLKRLQKFQPERVLIQDALNHRDEFWTQLLNDLNVIVRGLSHTSALQGNQHRMADWADLGYRICQTQGRAESFKGILRKLDTERADFLLKGDPIFEALMEWVPQNQGRPVETRVLYEELKALSKIRGLGEGRSPFRDVRVFGRQLSQMMSNLSIYLNIESWEERARKRVYRFSILKNV